MRRVRVATQYQEELPVQRPLVRAFRRRTSGSAAQCRRRVQGRHPLQTSDALGAAAVQLGPQAVAFAVLLNKRFGLPYGKIAALLRDRFGLTRDARRAGPRGPSRGAPGAADLRARCARRCAAVRSSPPMKPAGASTPTCSGSGPLSPPETTVYAIQPGRGLAQAAQVIGARLCRRAAARRLAVVSAISRTPRIRRVSRICCAAVASLLLDYPEQPVRPRGQSDPAGRARHARRLSPPAPSRARARRRARPLRRAARAAAGSARPVAALAMRRFQQHLIVEFDAIFSFLFDPTLDATNWRAEHALRPAVVTRKMCGGGNRTAPRRRQSAGPRQSSSAPPISAASMPPMCSSRCSPRPRPSCRRASARSPRYTDPLNTDLPTPNSQ